MKGKFKLKPNKNRRYTHNRPYHGLWWEYGKEHHKECRKYMKGIRHKLLFHIPLTEEEEETVERTHLTATSQLDRQGNVRYKDGTDRWRYSNPKEVNYQPINH